MIGGPEMRSVLSPASRAANASVYRLVAGFLKAWYPYWLFQR
jgi:hypothetical protein